MTILPVETSSDSGAAENDGGIGGEDEGEEVLERSWF